MTARAAREAAFAVAAAAPAQTRVLLAALSWRRAALAGDSDSETARQSRAADRLTLAVDALERHATDDGLRPGQARVILAALAWRRAVVAGDSDYERPEMARAARRLLRAAEALEGGR